MRKETSEWSVRMLVDFEFRINVDAEFQRGKVWSQPQQALLIDSILRNFDIPKIYLRKCSPGEDFLFDVIDGKQRLTALWRFASDDFPLLRNAGEFPGLGNLGGMRWSELPRKAQDHLQFSNITVSKIENATDAEIHELFLRLQRGEPLNAAERRNAMRGPVRDFVADQLAQHDLWSNTGIRPARFGLAEHSAIILALSKARGPASLRGADLHKLYEDQQFNPNGELATTTLALLGALHEVARERRGTIKTRWGLVDLALVLMKLEGEELEVEAEEIMDFFVQFEEERRSVGNKLSDMQTRLVNISLEMDLQPGDIPEAVSVEFPEISSSMLTYYLAFAREGGTQDNVQTRSEIMFQQLRDYLKKEGD